ncbi:MAG: Terminase-like family protein [Clostridiales bacterium]|nr:Terminase-like family protein [Clostridiales bacterium]
MRRGEYEALYGGAAGGGKSDALLAEGLRQVHIPHYKGLILRKTYPQLSELVDRSRYIYQGAFPGAKYNQTTHVWTFPSGATITFGSMQHTKDRINYQGKRFDYIAFDELTHFTWDEYSYLFSRNRPGGAGTRVYIRAATNPGGIGHGWVKQRFITPAPPETTINEEIAFANERGELVTMDRKRVFIPAKVQDNKVLMSHDQNYIASLAMLPEQERLALMDGSWDSFSGQAFTEWRNNPDGYQSRIMTHVIAPFDIPGHWKIYRGFDWGYAKPFSVGWFAVDEQRRIFHIREYYGWNGTPNTGCKMSVQEVAENIRRIENDDPLLKGRKVIGVADPSIFQNNGGQSIADIMTISQVYFDKGDNSRIPGKNQFHYRLRFNARGIPMFYVFDTCVNFIRTFTELIYDDKQVEDINSDGEDHAYDMARYVLMENPITAPLPGVKTIDYNNPLL